MLQILYTEYPQFAEKFRMVAHHDGLPASATWVREGILAKYEPMGAKRKKGSAKKSAPKTATRPASRKEAGKSSAKKNRR